VRRPWLASSRGSPGSRHHRRRVPRSSEGGWSLTVRFTSIARHEAQPSRPPETPTQLSCSRLAATPRGHGVRDGRRGSFAILALRGATHRCSRAAKGPGWTGKLRTVAESYASVCGVSRR
jgi:hypothetical protein